MTVPKFPKPAGKMHDVRITLPENLLKKYVDRAGRNHRTTKAEIEFTLECALATAGQIPPSQMSKEVLTAITPPKEKPEEKGLWITEQMITKAMTGHRSLAGELRELKDYQIGDDQVLKFKAKQAGLIQ